MVAHGGTSVAGSFIQTLTMVDVATGWTECLPLLAREGSLVVEAINRAQSLFPWLLRGVDFDNDSAFMNDVVVPWCRKQKLEVTRSRAYKKNDQAFVDAFNSGGDIHRQTASIIFGVPVDDVTSDMRARAKTINFATIYGQGAHALSRQLKITNAEAKEFISTYFERFHGIRRYLDSMVEFAREHGFVETIFHRRRYIPELRDRNFNIRAFGERTAANSPIQGSAADLIKIAMIRIDRAIRDRKLESRMLLQVHDELVFELPPNEEAEVTTLVKYEMEHAADLSVPLVVDMGIGDSWLSTKLR